MADNTQLSTNIGTGDKLVTKSLTHSGDTAVLQSVGLMGVAGSEGAWTVADINGDATNGLDVDVTRSALPSGASTLAEQQTQTTSLAAIETAVEVLDNAISGSEMQVDVVAALPTGANSIGQVTANAGTNLNTSTLALEAGGNLAGAATSLAIIDDWDETDRAKVNIIAGQVGAQGGAGSVTALTQRVVLATDDPAVVDLAAIEVLLTTVAGDTTSIQTAVEILDNAISGSEMQVDIVAALPAGTNGIGKLTANSGVDIGDVDVTSIAAGTNTVGNVGLIGRTTGGMSMFKTIDLDETEEAVKASAGQVFSIVAFNTTAAPLWLKFYNATTANVTVGTTVPDLTFMVPANADSDGAGFVWNNEIGFAFSAAISVACTTGVADNDSGAPGANACVVMVGYV